MQWPIDDIESIDLDTFHINISLNYHIRVLVSGNSSDEFDTVIV